MKQFILLLLPAVLLSACEEKEVKVKEAQPIVLKAGMQKRVQQDNEFAFDLFRKTIASVDDKNVFISPLSVSIALGMAWNGADAETKSEMAAALKMADMTEEQINEYYHIMQSTLPTIDPSTKLNIANSIWYKEGFPVKAPFLQVNKDYFDAEIKPLDFSKPTALATINGWCADKTNQLIKEPLDQISADAVMYLINAIYFKGIWASKFDKKNTKTADFYAEGGKTVQVKMMEQLGSFGYMQDDMAQYIDLPYGNKAFSMTAILPIKGKTTEEMLETLDVDKWEQLLTGMRTKEVQVHLPKFKTKGLYNLNDPLLQMGMVKAFSDEADFSRITELDLLISRVIHSTYCDVNEEGTEAAAVTIVEVFTTSMPTYPTFIANRPFIFVIREKSTGVIMFMGKMGEVAMYQ